MRGESVMSIVHGFGGMEDPRVVGRIDHRLVDIITLALLAVLCGANTWTEVAAYGRSKESWLRVFLDLPHGIPSHDTFGRVFSLIDPEKFRQHYREWVEHFTRIPGERRVCIDGKTLCGSRQKSPFRKAVHLLSAWTDEDHLVLGQLPAEDHSNEITALPTLLDLIDLKGCVVTIDAMGCQKKVARKIKENGGDYLLTVKENQPQLYRDMTLFFDHPKESGADFQTHETVNKGHGRLEERRVTVTSDVQGIDPEKRWKDLRSIGRVETKRTVNGKTTAETRYFIASFYCCAERLGRLVRGHWSIENRLHWSLDVCFDEDACRVRKDHAPENLALLRRIALHLLKKETTLKRSLQAKRLSAGWDNDYLRKVLEGF